jgi:hypothetical protein
LGDIFRRIVTTFEVRGGNVTARLGQASQAWRQYGQGARQAANDQSYLNNQLKAFSTTWRYMVAGAGVSGAMSMVSNLSQIQRQLGLISAIGNVSGPGGQNQLLVGQRLTDLASDARQAAVDIVQPIGQVNDAIINLLSTVKNVPQNQIVPMIEAIGTAATLSQISVEDATAAFTTLGINFGKTANLKNITRTAQEFYMMINRVPGKKQAGGQIIGQLGQLASTAVAAHITQEQLFAMLTASLRGGVPPATGSRGLQYLFQTLSQPTKQTKEANLAFAGLGITPQFIASPQGGGWRALLKIMERVKKLGFKPGEGLKSQLATAEETMGGEADLPPSLLAGAGAEFAGTIFRRVHAFRVFVALFNRYMHEGGTFDDPNLIQEVQAFSDVPRGIVKDTEKLANAWKRARDQMNLPAAAQAIQTVAQDVATTFAPFINLAARGIQTGEKLEHGHQKAFGYSIGAVLAALGLGRLFGRGPGIGAASRLFGRGVVGAAAVQNMATGEQPKGTMADPIFVVVVGQLFNPRGPRGGEPTGGRGRGRGGPREPGSGVEPERLPGRDVPEKPTTVGGRMLNLAKKAPFGTFAGRAALVAGLTGGPAIILSQFLGETDPNTPHRYLPGRPLPDWARMRSVQADPHDQKRLLAMAAGDPRLSNLLRRLVGGQTNFSPAERDALKDLLGGVKPGEIEQRLNRIAKGVVATPEDIRRAKPVPIPRADPRHIPPAVPIPPAMSGAFPFGQMAATAEDIRRARAVPLPNWNTRTVPQFQTLPWHPGAGAPPIKLEGKASVNVKITHEKADGTMERKNVHVPVSLFESPIAVSAPQTRGKDTSLRV